MKVKYIRTRDTSELTTDLTVIEAETEDGTFVIKVIGYGTGEYRWSVASDNAAEIQAIVEVFGPAESDHMWHGETTLGKAMVWANETTFAHVVIDLICNY